MPGGATLPLTLESWRLIDAEQLDGWISPAATRCGRRSRRAAPRRRRCSSSPRVHEQPTFVLAPGHDAALLDAFAALGRGAPRRRARRRAAREHAAAARDHAPTRSACPSSTASSPSTSRGWRPRRSPCLQEAREEHARAAGLVALSAANDAELEVPGLGGELKPFQRAGVAYLLEQRRAFLADEQGLGKTIEALAALQADGAFPAIVVCPANLKLNWLREIERWLPDAARRWSLDRHRARRVRGRATLTSRSSTTTSSPRACPSCCAGSRARS